MYETSNIKMMAEFLKLRRKTQGTTVLFLGSRVGGLFRSNFLNDTLCYFSTNFDTLSPLQKFAACFRILNRDMLSLGKIYEILRIALNQANVEEADVCVAELAKRRFVNRLV